MLTTGWSVVVNHTLCNHGSVRAVVHMLWIPCPGRFMWPLAVAGLWLRYLITPLAVRLGHPLRYPRWFALRSVEIFGLHKAWWANLILFVSVCTVCVKKRIGVEGGHGHWHIQGLPVELHRQCDGNRLVSGSLLPTKITLPLYMTPQSKKTSQPATFRTRILKREVIEWSGMVWPMSTVGRPSMWISHSWVNNTCCSSASKTRSGGVVLHLFLTGIPSIIKIVWHPNLWWHPLFSYQKLHLQLLFWIRCGWGHAPHMVGLLLRHLMWLLLHHHQCCWCLMQRDTIRGGTTNGWSEHEYD